MKTILFLSCTLACLPLPLARRAPPAPQATPISDPTQRFEYAGFSILPPNGPGWFLAPPLPTPDGPISMAVNFGKVLDHVGTAQIHTAGAEVMIWDLETARIANADDLLRFSNDQTESAVGLFIAPRHRLLSSHTAIDPAHGRLCVAYDVTFEDTGVPYAPGEAFILETHGFRCVHPRWPRALVDVYVSERFVKGERAFHPDAELAPFLGSLRFTDERPTFVDTIRVGNGPQGVVAAQGSIWVAYGNNGLARIDPASQRVSAQLRAGGDPIGIAAGFGSVWVANRGDGTVSRIDASTNQTQATIRVGGGCFQLAAGEGAVWVTSALQGDVERIDPATNQVTARIDVGRDPRAVTAAFGSIWVARYQAGKLLRVDPRTNSVVATIDVPPAAGDVAEGFGALWVASSAPGLVSRIDPATNSVVATIAIGTRPSGIIAGPNAVWVTRYDESSISRIDPRTNKPAGRPIAVGRNPAMLTFGEGALWVSNAFSASVSRVEP